MNISFFSINSYELFKIIHVHEFIKISDEFSNRSTSNTLGIEALYQIATLPETERTKEH